MITKQTATLVLQDGSVFSGTAFGAQTDAVFELVFNTSMTGYQEILTDPSYRGQGVLFTVPHIGNVGINPQDYESEAPQVSAIVLQALSPMVSNWRAEQDLSSWLAQHGVPGISEVDTRYITRLLRDGGTQKAALSTRGTRPDDLLQMARQWPGLDGRDMVREVTCPSPYAWAGDAEDHWISHQARIESLAPVSMAAYDFGVKRNILRCLASYGASVTVLPATTPVSEALVLKPDAVFLSNGPGDPEGLPYALAAVRDLLDNGIPILGICLGHQLIGMALGGRKSRLKFGHHAGNHPVQDLRTGKVQITAQNHNYCIEADSLDPALVEITHLSLNDGSLEGLRLRERLVMSVQYHPEAAPGPHDALPVFEEFFNGLHNQ